jgi:pilus assembly protein CpaB
VAYALPVARYSSVAWAIQPGDHVDVLISLLVVELDEEFQTALPNSSSCVQPTEEEGCQGGLIGRLEVLPNGWVVNLTPNEAQRPRLVTQLTVQDAIVLHVGDWPGEEDLPTPEEELLEEEGAPQPTPAPRAQIEPVTLIVTPQDAMVLKYAEEVGASVDLVLRSAEDTGEITTEAVTLQYIFDRFDIELPPKLPYGVTPPLKSLRSDTAGGAGVGESVVE